MPINPIPIRSEVSREDERSGRFMATPAWTEFFQSVFDALMGWTRSYTGNVVHDFGSIAAHSQATVTMTVNGARAGDPVLVRPTTAVIGIIIDGTVTADNQVTVRAVNYSSSSIDPASQTYNVLVFQQ